MRWLLASLSAALVLAASVAPAAEVESRVLTHYLPQDFLETVVRTENWTEVVLKFPGGLRKGDVVRVWAGGLIDRGDGEKPGECVNGPAGVEVSLAKPPVDAAKLALSHQPADTFALLFKGETSGLHRCRPPGKPLEIKIAKDNEHLWVGFNDERGRYLDNHLGRGLRHEFDPLWVRIEVVRTIVD
jgi:hypothetical protein